MADQRPAVTTRREVVQADTPDAVADEAARRFVSAARAAVEQRGAFHVALSGGSTPRAMYQKLADPTFAGEVTWSQVHLFFSDERFVPPDSPDSNYFTALAELISKVPIPHANVHPYATVDVDPAASARSYQHDIVSTLGDGSVGTPRFDLIFLGMGADGHTASLFPDTPALSVVDRLVVENYVPKVQMWRLTFTYTLLNAAQTVMFLVQGEDKAQRVQEILNGGSDLPAARVQPSNGIVEWLLDRAAAGLYDASSHAAPTSHQQTGS